MVTDMIYEFRLALRDVGIPVWRDVLVDSTESFYDFNIHIQTLFGWSDMFEHSFEITRSRGVNIPPIIIEAPSMDAFDDYTDESDPKDDFPEDSLVDSLVEDSVFDSVEEFDENEDKPLSTYFEEVEDHATYTYFTDALLEIDVTLSEIVAPQDDIIYPFCTNAENLAPEEMDDRGDILHKKDKLIYSKTDELVASINNELSLLGDADLYDYDYDDIEHDEHFDDDEIFDEPYDAGPDDLPI